MQDFEHPYREPATAPAVPHAAPARPKARWAAAGPLLVGALGVMLAAATLAVFLVWKGSVSVQMNQLRGELAAVQSQAASQAAGTSTSLSGLTRRVDSIAGDVNDLGNMLAGYTTVCTTDLTGPAGPAAYSFACAPKS